MEASSTPTICRLSDSRRHQLWAIARDRRPPFSKADAESIKNPTLFVGGANTKGTLPQVLRALAAHVPNSKTVMIPNTTHPMFEQAPQRFCEIVLEFLAG